MRQILRLGEFLDLGLDSTSLGGFYTWNRKVYRVGIGELDPAFPRLPVMFQYLWSSW